MEPQRDLATGTTGRLSRKVVAPVRGAVPYPHLSDNTLVLSDLALLAPLDGKLYLQFRWETIQDIPLPMFCCDGKQDRKQEKDVEREYEFVSKEG